MLHNVTHYVWRYSLTPDGVDQFLCLMALISQFYARNCTIQRYARLQPGFMPIDSSALGLFSDQLYATLSD